MNKSLLVAALAALAITACGKKEEAPAPAPAPAPAAEAPAPAAPAAAPAAIPGVAPFDAATKILINMATGCAFIEALTIYALVFAFVLAGKL